jgi:hypothetical protein
VSASGTNVRLSVVKVLVRIVLIMVAVVAVGFIAIQFVPVERDNPPVVSEPNWDSPETRALAQRACFDCHSNETVWPWYSYVAPVSWMISRHVHDGRAVLNFSDWGNVRGEAGDPEEIAEVIYEGYMPLPNYVLLHPSADLTQAEREQLVRGLQATIASSPNIGREGGDYENGDND